MTITSCSSIQKSKQTFSNSNNFHKRSKKYFSKTELPESFLIFQPKIQWNLPSEKGTVHFIYLYTKNNSLYTTIMTS